MYKLVDTFNGWEGDERFPTKAGAKKALDSRAKEFFAYPGHQNALFMKTIIKADARWWFNCNLNKFVWS